MQPDLYIVTMTMIRSIRDLHEDGKITSAPAANIDIAEFYGFRPVDVAAIHTHKAGVGLIVILQFAKRSPCCGANLGWQVRLGIPKNCKKCGVQLAKPGEGPP